MTIDLSVLWQPKVNCSVQHRFFAFRLPSTLLECSKIYRTFKIVLKVLETYRKLFKFFLHCVKSAWIARESRLVSNHCCPGQKLLLYLFSRWKKIKNDVPWQKKNVKIFFDILYFDIFLTNTDKHLTKEKLKRYRLFPK